MRAESNRPPQAVLLLLGLALAAGSVACTGSSPGEDANASDKDSTQSDANEENSGARSDTQKAPKNTSVGAAEITPASGKGLAFAMSKVTDPPSDAVSQGDPSPLGEIREGYVRGMGKQVELILVLDGQVPEQMEDDATFMIVAWNFAGSKRYPTVGITAQAGTDGWILSAAENNELIEDFPATLTADGDRAIITLPWRSLGGPHQFTWSAASTWSSTSGEEPKSSADNIPKARFPRRKGR